MDNDLNTPKALASLFTFVHELNAALDRGVTLLDRLAAKRLLQKIVGGVLGIELVISGPEQVPHVVRQLLKEREAARTQKNFVRADELRIQIEERGFTIEDTPHGARLKSL